MKKTILLILLSLVLTLPISAANYYVNNTSGPLFAERYNAPPLYVAPNDYIKGDYYLGYVKGTTTPLWSSSGFSAPVGSAPLTGTLVYDYDAAFSASQTPTGGGLYSNMSAPPGCASGFVPYFDASLKLQCSPTVYAPSTDTTTFRGAVAARNITATALPASGGVTITNQGTAGATTYTYSLQACLADGTCNAAGPASSTAAGVATLSAANPNRLTWSAVPGAASYKIRRDVGGATQGVIWSGTATTVDDTGLAGDGTVPPPNTTGAVSAAEFTVTVPGNGKAVLGPEILANAAFTSNLAGWTAGAGWSWDAGGVTHTAGSGTATLAQPFNIPANDPYWHYNLFELNLTIFGRTAGSVGITIGGSTVYLSDDSTAFTSSAFESSVQYFSGPNSAGIVITPTSDFDGTIDEVSVKRVTQAPRMLALFNEGNATPQIEMRASTDSSSVFIGWAAGSAWRGADWAQNTALGVYALPVITTGTRNTAIGGGSLPNLTNGSANIGIGPSSLSSLKSGSDNVAVGVSSMANVVSGGNNVGVGRTAGYLASGSGNTFVGGRSGYLSGATPAAANAVTTGSGLTFVGKYSGLGSGTQRTNAGCFGFECYVDADNTYAIGDENVTDVLAGSAGQARLRAATARLSNLPVYADNAAALAGGLVAGDVYRTSTGVLMVTY